MRVRVQMRMEVGVKVGVGVEVGVGVRGKEPPWLCGAPYWLILDYGRNRQ